LDKIIELENLSKCYGDFKAVDALNLTIEKGEVFGLLGPNGAGKSTTILMMLGLTEPSGGRVKVCGLDATRQPVEVKRKVGYLPEDVGFYDDLTGFENLLFTARLNGQSDQKAYPKAAELLNQVGLGAHAEKKVGKYSRGMRQRLGLADVLVKEPEVIILDEPTLGIDPKGVKELLELILQLSREKGLTVLLSSHHLHQVQQICTRVGLFVSGKLIASGNVESLSSQLISKHPYLIEARVAEEPQHTDLRESLSGVPGVEEVTLLEEGLLHIGCSEDNTAAIANAIVASGVQLTHLSKKTYGLDDIYQRYFENTTSHEIHQSS
jgi:ABC-2 type transport system ATP-binding protein